LGSDAGKLGGNVDVLLLAAAKEAHAGASECAN
jgi:hypothetical protein